MPIVTGSMRTLVDVPAKETPALAKPNNGTIKNATGF
jgi:hypothetical protein